MKRHTNLTLHLGILEHAHALQVLLRQSSLSGLVEQLIREEYERRAGPLKLSDTHPTQPAPPPKPDPKPVYKIPAKRNTSPHEKITK